MTRRNPRTTRIVALAGLIGGPAIWAIAMQLGQILPYVDCSRHVPFLLVMTAAGTVGAVLAGAASWAVSRGGQAFDPQIHFLAVLSSLACGVFVYALALQTMVSLVVSGCAR
jgi:hypothetical protein